MAKFDETAGLTDPFISNLGKHLIKLLDLGGPTPCDFFIFRPKFDQTARLVLAKVHLTTLESYSVQSDY